MKGYIRAQSVIFGDFSNYNVDSKSIYELIGEMKEFEVIPNVKDEIQIEIQGNIPNQKIIKRVELNSFKNKLIASISIDNIIIQAMPEINVSSQTSDIDIGKFIIDTKKIFNILLRVINAKANRVSLVTTYLDENNLSNQYEKYVKPDGFFKGKDVFEWNTRSAVREKIMEISNDEINIIYNISRTQGVFGSNIPMPTNQTFDGVLKEIDINTIPENILNRIDYSYIERFYDMAILKKNEIERMMGDGK